MLHNIVAVCTEDGSMGYGGRHFSFLEYLLHATIHLLKHLAYNLLFSQIAPTPIRGTYRTLFASVVGSSYGFISKHEYSDARCLSNLARYTGNTPLFLCKYHSSLSCLPYLSLADLFPPLSVHADTISYYEITPYIHAHTFSFVYS